METLRRNRRTRIIKVRLSETEYNHLASQAVEFHTTASGLIRLVLWGKVQLKPQPGETDKTNGDSA